MRRRVVALAGGFQAAALAQSIAFHGHADEDALAASVTSVYAIDASSAETVYGGLSGLRLGLRVLLEHFTARRRDLEHLRCVMTLWQLARKLTANAELSRRLRDGVEAARVHAQDPGASLEDDLARLGELYLKTVSTLSPRVIVRGDPLYLQQPRFVGQVRAVLLAGVRAGVLWHQLGGSRWQLLIKGRTVAATARKLLAEIEA